MYCGRTPSDHICRVYIEEVGWSNEMKQLSGAQRRLSPNIFAGIRQRTIMFVRERSTMVEHDVADRFDLPARFHEEERHSAKYVDKAMI